MDVASSRAASRVAELLGRDGRAGSALRPGRRDRRAWRRARRSRRGGDRQVGLARGRDGNGRYSGASTVVSTTGALSEAQLAFAGLHQLLLPLLGGLDLLPDPQRRALEAAFGIAEGDAPDLFLIGLATLGLVAERAAETPLLFVVEDAHWLDRPSAQVLEFVARRVESDPAVLLFAVREGLPSSFDDADLPELRLAGLDRGCVERAPRPRCARRCRPISGAGSSRRRPATPSP